MLGRLLSTHIINAVKTTGTFDPDENMFLFEESLTGEEYEKASGFLKWVHDSQKVFGTGNIEEVYKEYEKRTRQDT